MTAFKNNTTSNTTLENILQRRGIFAQVVTRPFALTQGNFIINLDDDLLDETRGTHWVAVIVKKDVIFYYDSYGIPPFREIAEDNRNIIWNDIQHQDLSSTACGFYAVALLLSVYDSDSFVKFSNSFSKNYALNDKLLKKKFKFALKV